MTMRERRPRRRHVLKEVHDQDFPNPFAPIEHLLRDLENEARKFAPYRGTMKPEELLLATGVTCLVNYGLRLLFPGLSIGPHSTYTHPEGMPHQGPKIDERQLGRSEVIREIARGKPN